MKSLLVFQAVIRALLQGCVDSLKGGVSLFYLDSRINEKAAYERRKQSEFGIRKKSHQPSSITCVYSVQYEAHRYLDTIIEYSPLLTILLMHVYYPQKWQSIDTNFTVLRSKWRSILAQLGPFWIRSHPIFELCLDERYGTIIDREFSLDVVATAAFFHIWRFMGRTYIFD